MKDDFMELDLDADTIDFPHLEDFIGALAYLDEMRDGLPHLHERSISQLTEHSIKNSQSWEEYCGDSFEVEVIYRFHVPRALYFSFLIYLTSLVENKLNEVAKVVERVKLLPLSFRDINGDGSAIERVKKYISKLGGIEIAQIEGWDFLRDLAKIRNILVHQGGMLIPDKKHRKEIQELSKRNNNLVTATPAWDHEDAKINFGDEYCRVSAKQAYAFFQKLIKKCRLSVGKIKSSSPKIEPNESVSGNDD
jgi:hypothetical protein